MALSSLNALLTLECTATPYMSLIELSDYTKAGNLVLVHFSSSIETVKGTRVTPSLCKKFAK